MDCFTTQLGYVFRLWCLLWNKSFISYDRNRKIWFQIYCYLNLLDQLLVLLGPGCWAMSSHGWADNFSEKKVHILMSQLEKLLSLDHFSYCSFCQHTIYSGRPISVITIGYWSYCRSTWVGLSKMMEVHESPFSVNSPQYKKKSNETGICFIKIDPYWNEF